MSYAANNPNAVGSVVPPFSGGGGGGGVLAGDVTGPIAANTVVAIQSNPVSAAAPALGDVFQWDGAAWTPTPASGLGVDMQDTYLASGAPPQITLVAGQPLTIRDNSTPIGNVLIAETNVGFDFLTLSPTLLGFGTVGQRLALFRDTVGGARGGLEFYPDGIVSTAANALPGVITWSSTITSNIPGGGGLGNDSFGGMIQVNGTFVLLDQGNLFNTALLFNNGLRLELQANAGPVYTLVNQPTFVADGGAFTVSQHNALRCQGNWGPNVNGGSLTQTDATYIFMRTSVDATVGSASVTVMNNILMETPILTAGGTIGTWRGMFINDISGPTTIRGIESAMNSGQFIRHTGTAPAQFGGAVQLGLGTTFDVSLSRGAANRLDLAAGDDFRLAGGQIQFSGTTETISRTGFSELVLTAGTVRTSAALEIDGDLDHDGSNIGFFGTVPAAQAAAYTPTNVTPDRSYDADATTLDEIADVLGTLIADLQTYGLLQ